MSAGVSNSTAALKEPSYRFHKIIAALVVFSQILISVTGSIVRVTASGLGCPSWPQCFPGSYVPVYHNRISLFHQIIEFANRQLAVWFVTMLSIFIVVISYRAHFAKKVIILSWIIPIGTILQAVIGGVTVLCGLLWWIVSLHLLVSLLMIWFAMNLYTCICSTSELTLHGGFSAESKNQCNNKYVYKLRAANVIATVAAALTVIAGTLTTGAGPLAGDISPERTVVRLYIDIKYLLTIHTCAVITLIMAVCYLAFLLCKEPDSNRSVGTIISLFITLGTQICIGILQTVWKLPPVLVVLHVLGACLIIASLARIYARTQLIASLA